MKTLKSKKEMFEYILKEYQKHDVELNLCHFETNVKMTEEDIIKTYIKLQKHINGDDVICIKNPQKENSCVSGEIVEIPFYKMKNIFSGNLEDYLAAINIFGVGENKYLFRLTEISKEEAYGMKQIPCVDFVL